MDRFIKLETFSARMRALVDGSMTAHKSAGTNRYAATPSRMTYVTKRPNPSDPARPSRQRLRRAASRPLATSKTEAARRTPSTMAATVCKCLAMIPMLRAVRRGSVPPRPGEHACYRTTLSMARQPCSIASPGIEKLK